MMNPNYFTTSQEIVHELIMSSLSHYYKMPHYLLQERTPSFEGISPLWLALPGKTVHFFFSILSKNLSSRFNSVAVYRLNFSYNGNNQKNSYKNWKRVLPLVLWRRVFHEFYVQTRVLLSDNSWTFLSLFPISSILHQPSYIFSVSTWIELLNMSPFPRSLAVE